MKKDYLVNYLVSDGETAFNCYLITSELRDMDKQIKEHYEKICDLYDEGNNFKFLPNSPKYYELHQIDIDVELTYLGGDQND